MALSLKEFKIDSDKCQWSPLETATLSHRQQAEGQQFNQSSGFNLKPEDSL